MMFDDDRRGSTPRIPDASDVADPRSTSSATASTDHTLIVGRVQRVLITGMSATSKSIVIHELARLG
jgi:uridine phosphorylase